MGSVREPYPVRQETMPDICVCCGAPVPEGRMICWNCEHEYEQDDLDAMGTWNISPWREAGKTKQK